MIILLLIGLGVGGYFLYKYLQKDKDESGGDGDDKKPTTETPTTESPSTESPSTETPENLPNCKNGGESVLIDGDYKCKCPPGFSGNLCEKKICFNKGLLNKNNTCDCNIFYEGDFCEKPKCLNGGNLVQDEKTKLYSCQCPSDFEGDFCEKPNCKNGGTLKKKDNGTYVCECPEGFDGKLCQCNMNSLKDSPQVQGWYCKGNTPQCNLDGTYSVSDKVASTCTELENTYNKYSKYIPNWREFQCCNEDSKCAGECFTDCNAGEFGVQSMTSCRCPPYNKDLCPDCGDNQLCQCDALSKTPHTYECRDLYSSKSECPEKVDDKQCVDQKGNPLTMECKPCGDKGFFLYCPGTKPNQSYLQCLSNVETNRYPVWDPISNSVKPDEEKDIKFDKGIPIYPTFSDEKCTLSCGEAGVGLNTSFLTDNSINGMELWDLAGNPPGIITKINGRDYFVEYKLDQNMKSTFFNKFAQCQGFDSKAKCNVTDCKPLNRIMETNDRKNTYPICWTQDIPTCQDEGKPTQLVKFKDGTVEPLWICNTDGNNWDSFVCNVNSKVIYNFKASSTDDQNCIGKSNSFLTDKDCNPVQLLPNKGCIYSDFNTDFGGDNEKIDYYIDYCDDDVNPVVRNC